MKEIEHPIAPTLKADAEFANDAFHDEYAKFDSGLDDSLLEAKRAYRQPPICVYSACTPYFDTLSRCQIRSYKWRRGESKSLPKIGQNRVLDTETVVLQKLTSKTDLTTRDPFRPFQANKNRFLRVAIVYSGLHQSLEYGRI